MGYFGYICNGCKTSIRGDCLVGGENCVLKHIRHGEVIGETTGHYNGYGRVVEDPKFRAYAKDYPENPNSHEEICKSEYCLPDSKHGDLKLYEGDPVSWTQFLIKKNIVIGDRPPDEIYTEWENLPKVSEPPRSGIEAWHVKCFEKAPQEEKDKHIISESDPNQSWGAVRKEFL